MSSDCAIELSPACEHELHTKLEIQRDCQAQQESSPWLLGLGVVVLLLVAVGILWRWSQED